MEFWLEICLIIVGVIIFCLFFRWVIIEWKNRLLLGGYFKENAELLREAARQQSRSRREAAERRRQEQRAPRNLFVHIPPPEFEVALKMNRVYYIDVEDAPPSYDFALKRESQIVETHKYIDSSTTAKCAKAKMDSIVLHLVAKNATTSTATSIEYPNNSPVIKSSSKDLVSKLQN